MLLATKVNKPWARARWRASFAIMGLATIIVATATPSPELTSTAGLAREHASSGEHPERAPYAAPPQGYVVDLPDWYEGERVHIHTRYSAAMAVANPENFWRFSQDIAELGGPNVITRFMKGGTDGAWWPSEVGTTDVGMAALNRNVAQRLIDSAHALGQRQVAYYHHFEDPWVVQNRPEWLTADLSGEPTAPAAPWGPWVSLTSPYADYLDTRIAELSSLGADGIYFDGTHQPPQDFSSNSVALYVEWSHGHDYVTATESQRNRFRQFVLGRFFQRARDTMHRINPDSVSIVSVNSVSLDTLRRSVDAPKFEASVFGALGGSRSAVTMLTDVGLGWPHLWTPPLTEDPATFTSELLAYGAVYNRDVRESQSSQLLQFWPSYGELFALSAAVSPAMVDVQPLRHARVVINGSYKVTPSRTLPEPIRAAWQALDDQHVSAGYVSLRQLAEAGHDPMTSVLVFPQHERAELEAGATKLMRDVLTVVRSHEIAGGTTLFRDDLADGWAQRTARSAPVRLTQATSADGMAAFMSRDGQSLVVNINGDDSQGVVVQLSKQLIPSITAAAESISGTKLRVREAAQYWLIDVPRFATLAQLVIEIGPAGPPANPVDATIGDGWFWSRGTWLVASPQ